LEPSFPGNAKKLFFRKKEQIRCIWEKSYFSGSRERKKNRPRAGGYAIWSFMGVKKSNVHLEGELLAYHASVLREIRTINEGKGKLNLAPEA